jgi:hypothetical protein
MNLTKFVLIVPEKDKEGHAILKRLDTLDAVPRARIHRLNLPPITLKFYPGSLLPPYITIKKGFREKSDSLLVVGKTEIEGGDYYSLAYCKRQ